MLTPEILEGFANAVLRKGYDEAKETPDFHRKVWEYCCSPSPFVAIAAPRGHAKSTVVTHAYTLACVLFRERDYVVLLSDTTAQAVQFLGDIKRELLDNEDLKKLFNIKGLIKDTEDDIVCVMEDGYLFRIQAKGSEQKVRGLKWNGKRPNLIIGDDLENDEIVLNKERRDKFKRWFNGALLPIRSEGGIVRVVGTILHLDSLLEGLMPEKQLIGDRKKHLVLEPLSEYADIVTPWKSIKFRAHDEDFTHILWKEQWPIEKLKAERARLTVQGLGDVYSQEYLNIPLDESNTFFKRNDFLPIKKEDKENTLSYYITADLAISQRERSDYSVFIVAGLDSNGILYLVNVVRDRFDAQQLVDQMLTLQRVYRPELFGVEAGTIQKSLGPFLNKQMISTGIFIPLQLLKPSMDKITRAQSIRARMRAGACKFDREAEWFLSFEEELMRFPRDKHDDQVDAWAYMGLMLDKMVEAPTPEEEEEEEYRVSLQTESDLGICQSTGY